MRQRRPEGGRRQTDTGQGDWTDMMDFSLEPTGRTTGGRTSRKRKEQGRSRDSKSHMHDTELVHNGL